MKITAARLIITSPEHNFVTLKIETNEGVYGLGDATLNGRELAVAAYLEEHVLPCLIGRDPFQIEDIWQYLYRGAYWRRGPVTMTAIAAVDVALWDIKGKALNTPVYNLLGGRSRNGVLVYTHANGRDIAETLESVQRHVAEGYLAVRAQSGVPSVASSYGVPKAGKPYEPAERGLPFDSPGLPNAISTLSPLSSRNSALTSVLTFTYCMMSTIALLPLRPAALAKRSSPTISSGWKILAPPNCRSPLNSFGVTPQCPSPPAKSSTPSGTRTT